MRVRERDGRYRDPRRAGRLRGHARQRRGACSTTSRRASPIRSGSGPHGLPLIGHADWNDCLNLNCFSTEPDESFQTAGDIEGSTRRVSHDRGSLPLRVPRARCAPPAPRPPRRRRPRPTCTTQMLAAIEEHAWDGDWYLRAYDAAGDAGRLARVRRGADLRREPGLVRARRCRRGQRTRAPRARERPRAALHRARIVLVQPAYSRYRVELGEITSYPPGYKENAGVFCHNNTWIKLAWCLLGEGDRALEYYLTICPSAQEGGSRRTAASPTSTRR